MRKRNDLLLTLLFAALLHIFWNKQTIVPSITPNIIPSVYHDIRFKKISDDLNAYMIDIFKKSMYVKKRKEYTKQQFMKSLDVSNILMSAWTSEC